MPAPPNVDINRNPIDEQLAQILDEIPKMDPEINDLSKLHLEFLIT